MIALAKLECETQDREAGIQCAYCSSMDEGELLQWLRMTQARIDETVSRDGALLLRGLDLNAASLNRVLSEAFGKDLLEYVYRSTPRTSVGSGVYTASEYHPGETIMLHNENSYTNRWPMRIAFYCEKAAPKGGQTPVADCRTVLARMNKSAVEEFVAKGVMIVRNYLDIDLPWTEVFQTNDKAVVDAFCKENAITAEWLEGGGLRTKQRCRTITSHPKTGESIWFNAVHMFHVSSLKPDVSKALTALLGTEGLPRNAYFADGSTIPSDLVQEVRNAYLKSRIIFDWKAGDLLLLDNMLYAHGREPFEGERRVLVGMAGDSSLYYPETAPV